MTNTFFVQPSLKLCDNRRIINPFRFTKIGTFFVEVDHQVKAFKTQLQGYKITLNVASWAISLHVHYQNHWCMHMTVRIFC